MCGVSRSRAGVGQYARGKSNRLCSLITGERHDESMVHGEPADMLAARAIDGRSRAKRRDPGGGENGATHKTYSGTQECTRTTSDRKSPAADRQTAERQAVKIAVRKRVGSISK